jgi:hypothetical protein
MDDINYQNEYDESQSGDPRGWLERLTRRYLGDVRIHDSHQAGELARRLGARAFTVGRDIYVRPELMRPMNRRSASLLAHELYHVAEQTGGAAGAAPDMPLFAPPTSQPRSSSPSGSAEPGFSFDLTAGQSDGRGSGSLAVQRALAPSGSEQRAESAEAAALNAKPRRRKAQPKPPDPEELAERVYQMMLTDVRIDYERGIG